MTLLLRPDGRTRSETTGRSHGLKNIHESFMERPTTQEQSRCHFETNKKRRGLSRYPD